MSVSRLFGRLRLALSLAAAPDLRSKVRYTPDGPPGGEPLRPPRTPAEERAFDALTGLAIGDAIGAPLDGSSTDESRAETLEPGGEIAPWTDDTQMALSVVEVLLETGRIDPDRLARSFAQRYQPWRGYGRATHTLLAALRNGTPWRQARTLVFPDGSFGNGSAMRVAPLGAFLAEASRETVIEQAELSANVTHSHPEAKAGAAAVALTAWLAARSRGATEPPAGEMLLDVAGALDPSLETTRRIRDASDINRTAPFADVIERLGNGRRVSCQDTVPLALWIAAHHLDRYEAAVRRAVAAGGDTDTLAAIVGGVVASRVGRDAIPARWIAVAEPVPVA
jgi:ADP-ribosylglycohydrolase